MAPKFRGNSEDWLDEEARDGEGGGSGRGRKSAERQKPAPLAAEKANGTVAEVFPKQCRVRLDAESGNPGRDLLCSYRRASIFGGSEQGRERSPVAVGDRVLVRSMSPDSGVVEGLCERTGWLTRPAPGREGRKVFHVLASNLDTLVVVASTRLPDFTPGLVDRFLVAAAAARIQPLVCVTKMDLVSSETDRMWALYRDLGYPLFEVCAKRDEGIEGLRERLRGRSAAFCGQSGVGKTSLLRALLGVEVGRIAEVSEATGKGRHTTTGAVLLDGPSGSRWIDTPGVREFGLAGLGPENLHQFFPEMGGLRCAAPACRHDGEAGCAAPGLARYESYRRILKSLSESGS